MADGSRSRGGTHLSAGQRMERDVDVDFEFLSEGRVDHHVLFRPRGEVLVHFREDKERNDDPPDKAHWQS